MEWTQITSSISKNLSVSESKYTVLMLLKEKLVVPKYKKPEEQEQILG